MKWQTPPMALLVELAKLKLRSALVQLLRTNLSRVAAKLPTELLDDARIAATEELAQRGLHVITHRTRPRKAAQGARHGA